MAQGDLKLFNAANAQMDDGTHDLDSDTFKLGIISNAATPAIADLTPTWDDYSGDEVTTTANYLAGGPSVGYMNLVTVGRTVTVDWNVDVAITGIAGGDPNAYWGILYNASAVDSPALGFIDLDGPVTMVSDLDIVGPLWTKEIAA